MKLQKTAILLASLACLAYTGAASAYDGVCATELDTLGWTIKGADFTNDRDQERLGAKVEAAGGKLQLGKPYDALGKLDDIRVKVTDLVNAAKTKLDPADGEDILGDIADAEACIYNNIGAF